MRNVLLIFVCLVAAMAFAQVGVTPNPPLGVTGTSICANSTSCAANLAAAVNIPSDFVVRKDVREVRVAFNVTDKHGRHIAALTRKDFQISDNGAPVVELTDFRQESDLPLDVIILIDSSRSTTHELPVEKQLALEFLHGLLRPQDRAMIADFNTSLNARGTFTNHFDQLEESVRTMHAGGLTALNDSLYELASEYLSQSTNARKVVVAITDGYDSVSRRGFSDAMNSVLRNDVTVYTITVDDKKSLYPEKCLERLSGETGGHSYIVKDLRKLKATFTQIDTDLRTYYVAAYRAPDSARDSFHSLDIQLATKGLYVQSKKGYFRSE